MSPPKQNQPRWALPFSWKLILRLLKSQEIELQLLYSSCPVFSVTLGEKNYQVWTGGKTVGWCSSWLVSGFRTGARSGEGCWWVCVDQNRLRECANWSGGSEASVIGMDQTSQAHCPVPITGPSQCSFGPESQCLLKISVLSVADLECIASPVKIFCSGTQLSCFTFSQYMK